jgi:hypothetical protein
MSNWYPLGPGISGPNNIAFISQFCLSHGYLFAGGSFTSAGNVSATNLAIWDGIGWIPTEGNGIYIFDNNTLNPGVVNSIVEYDDKVFIAGKFNSVNAVNPDNTEPTLDTSASIICIEFNIDGTLSWKFIPGFFSGSEIGTVEKLRVYNNNLYAIGKFDQKIQKWNKISEIWESPEAEILSALGGKNEPYDLIQTGSTSYYVPDAEEKLGGLLSPPPKTGPHAFFNNRIYRVIRKVSFPQYTESLEFSVDGGNTWVPFLNSIPTTYLFGSGSSTQVGFTRISYLETVDTGNGTNVLSVAGVFKRLGSDNRNSGGILTFGFGIWNGSSWNNLGIDQYASPALGMSSVYFVPPSNNIASGYYISGRFNSIFPGLNNQVKVAVYTSQTISTGDIWPPYGSELNYADVCAPIFKCGVVRDIPIVDAPSGGQSQTQSQSINITFGEGTDGQTINVEGIEGPPGPPGPAGENGLPGSPGSDGVGIQTAIINEDCELILTLTNNDEINAGSVACGTETKMVVITNSVVKTSSPALFEYTIQEVLPQRLSTPGVNPWILNIITESDINEEKAYNTFEFANTSDIFYGVRVETFLPNQGLATKILFGSGGHPRCNLVTNQELCEQDAFQFLPVPNGTVVQATIYRYFESGISKKIIWFSAPNPIDGYCWTGEAPEEEE